MDTIKYICLDIFTRVHYFLCKFFCEIVLFICMQSDVRLTQILRKVTCYDKYYTIHFLLAFARDSALV